MLNMRRYQWWKKRITPSFRRIVLSASIFLSISASLAFHVPLYNSEVSVEYNVVYKDGKSFAEYPTKEDAPEIQKFKKKYIFLAGVVGYTNAGRALSFKQTDYTYEPVKPQTPSSTWIDDGIINGKICWRLKFLTSGTFTPTKRVVIDIFLVSGGGGGGGNGNTGLLSIGSGGGGGYTGTWTSITLNGNQAYSIIIGAGGEPSANGWPTSGFDHSVSGGGRGYKVAGETANNAAGGAGGSGGGACGRTSTWVQGGYGGSDGSNGGAVAAAGGAGQGSTTREFGEAGATLYSGGGGGGSYSNSITAGQPGAGGGGRGYGSPGGGPKAGTANTGGGGGGGSSGATYYGAPGGSGILIIRNARA